ncbi:unnamed protein product, partial [Heterosigma akashiwo]
MGNTQQVPRGAPYNVRLAFYREVLAAIEKEEIEEMKTLSPGFVRLFFYWLQNVIAFPEGVIRAIWHGVFALVFLPFGLCAMKRSSVQQQGATNETAVVEKGETAPPAEANATTAQNNCLVATWVHHSNVAWLYVDSLLFTVGRNIICPWNPIWLYNLYTPINRPPPPPKPSRGLCDCEDCCRIECANFCARLVDAMTHVWLRLQRTLYCAIGCHEACAPELILGPLACCPHVQCAPPFWSLEARLARWARACGPAQGAPRWRSTTRSTAWTPTPRPAATPTRPTATPPRPAWSPPGPSPPRRPWRWAPASRRNRRPPPGGSGRSCWLASRPQTPWRAAAW